MFLEFDRTFVNMNGWSRGGRGDSDNNSLNNEHNGVLKENSYC